MFSFFKLYVIPDGSLCNVVYIVIYHNACVRMNEIVLDMIAYICGDM
jgi:hypothetical protein